MNNLLEGLNKEQLSAVMHKEGPVLIVAGAGTGKTTVISQRIAYLIEQGVAESTEILALTFTEKAAGEMEERVDQLLPLGYLDLWISTFHSFGERILRAHGIDMGLPGDFKLLNEFEQYSLVKKNLDKFDLDYYKPMGNPTKFINALLKHFSRAKDEDITPAEYLAYAEELKANMDGMLGGRMTKKKMADISKVLNISTESEGEVKELATQEVMRINEVANAYHTYSQLLLDESALDFGDLINYSLKLFRERKSVLEKYRKQFKFIMLDEFQDTNLAQYELIKLLAHPKNNLVVVGDDDQSIYKFRGASVSNILQFQKDFPKSKQIFLNNNYRNRQEILDLSYEFIKLNDPNRLEWQLAEQESKRAGKQENKKILNKKLKAQIKGKATIEVLAGENLEEEIKLVVKKIADLKLEDKEVLWNDFAILVRANDGAKEFCNALDMAGLPYQFLSSRGLYGKEVVLDVIAYLKLLDNYHESSAVFRILNLPIFDFTYQEIVNFNYFARKKAWSLFEVLKSFPNVNAQLKAKIDRVLKLINEHTKIARWSNVSELIIAFVNESGYLKHLMAEDSAKANESIGYLNQFLKRAKSFEANTDDMRVKEFLHELNLEIEAGEQGSLPFDPDSGPETIKVMTVHASKGLEFKYVFLVNMVDQRFPTIERKDPIQIPDDLVKEVVPEGDIHIEEERRLFYVAATRAKEHLYLTWAPDYGGTRKKKPSRFLLEAGLVENIEAEKKENKKEKESKRKKLERDLSLSKKITQKKKQEIVIPSYFSHTQLTAFKNCPYQYYFAHIIKVPTRGKFVFSFGQAMHLTLQKLFELVREKRGLGQGDLFGETVTDDTQVNISLDEVLDLYESCWVDDWYDSKGEKEKYRKKGKEIMEEFFNKYKDNWPQVESLEQGVNLKIGGYRIFGKIDRIDNCEDGGIQIVDYKTGRPKKQDAISLEDKEQLLIYQMAIEQAITKKVSNLQFYYLDNNTEINFLGKKKDIEKMEEKIIDRINGIKEAAETGCFPAKPGPLCKYCDFNSICEFRKS